ncbi:glycosyltransferase [Peribacillus sp. NPDC097295]|uniref:glycosyltransferase n=1 Tax=Peribacillus sp. NPDC097295 TaxID=3364402 RepID=UPI00381B0F28
MLFILIPCLTIFVIWTILNALCLPRLPKHPNLDKTPLVSIMVPMRNEDRNAESMVRCLQALTYPNIEFILLDDQSTDQTCSILEKATAGDSRFRILSGKKLPEQWVGKVHACHQLQQEAHGAYFLFVDADVRLKPHCLEKSLSLMNTSRAHLLTGFSAFEVPSFLSKLLVPMQHFVVFFHLPIMFANWTNILATTAAHGGFMLFERMAYMKMGGHEAVRSSLVEDVHIARKMKEQGFKVLLANITDEVSCRMYETNREVWAGFLKNIYNGLGRSFPLVVLLTIFYGFFYIGPLLLLVFGLFQFEPIYFIPYLLITCQRYIVDRMTNQRGYLSFLMPLSAASFICIMLASMWKSWSKQSYEWKGRYYS